MDSSTEWFSTWFDSPYYHILYAQRDEQEAAQFIAALQSKLALKEGDAVLDAACGKGRHAKTLHDLGLQVEGFDLSASNIEEAKMFETDNLHFFEHDLRHLLPKRNFYQVIFNFFTSFGYFDRPEENQLAFHVFYQALQPGGLLVMDFFNPSYVLSQLVPEETIVRGGISFAIKRWVENGYLLKSIDFSDQGEYFSFTEKVELISKSDFISFAAQAGFQAVDLLGDYQLNPFDEKTSPRMVFFWAKN